MMNETGRGRTLPYQSSGSGRSFGTPRHPSIKDPILSKRVCFYKSGDSQFNGLRMVINNRTFKTFDALLDSLSKKVPLPFGVRNITTPHGVHAIYTLDELEDGKSYICSDSRKVKPINLALARKKLPPWYHARPVSSRRRTVQQARFFPGQNLHKKEPLFVRTPKRLQVFRNGVPTVRHVVVLNKRTTPTFESILEYISELIQFHVLKLHTPDGRRVDGLPALILCSGTVVAAGREPFRPANYNTAISPVPTLLPTNRMSLRRLKALNRKKKALSYPSKSRKFSPSSERYIVTRIHDSIAESSFDLPSNLTNSVELESNRMLESVAETEGDICVGDGAGGQDCLLPTDDDIEKSFRVNQDGSMTVEMRVRLTLKEEETIHWTTTLSRSSVASQLNATCLPEPEAEQEISSLKSNSLDLQSPAASINKDKTEDNNDEDPPSMGSTAYSESCNDEDNIKAQTDMVSPKRAPTPGHIQIRKKEASMESIKSVTAEGIQEGMVGSYTYREQTENGSMTEKYCMVKQSSTKPVPKPRRFGSIDTNNINSKGVSTFKSGMAEILQIESSGEEVTETVLHIYEQQTCQDNFFANLCAQSAPFCRPATSGTGQLSSNNEFEVELWRPSTASESISIWRAESMSLTSDLMLPSVKTGTIEATNAQQRRKDKPQQREVNKDKRVSLKPKVINSRVRRLMSPGKRPKEKSAEASEKQKKVKTFSSAGFIKKIYGNKSRSARSMMKLKKGPTQNGDGGVTTQSSQKSDDTIKCTLKDPNISSELKENTSEKSKLDVASNEVSQPRGILTRQTSVHQEKKNENESYDVSESMSLPAVNSSSSVTNKYVENWLEKAHPNPTAYSDEESKKLEAKTENGRHGESENNNGLMIVAEEIKSPTLKMDLLPEKVQGASVKLRIQSFENKISSPSMRRTTVNQQNVQSHATTANTENDIKPHSISNKLSTEMLSGREMENKSNPIKISLQKATPSNTLSMDLPPPPPPDENIDLSNAEDCVMDASSVASSPLYRLSSLSSQMSDNHPLSISPTSDKAVSPTENTMETTTSVQPDIPSTLGEAPLPRTPSIKRAPLVSNLSLDRKMSLRKACVDKYTLCSDATSETTTSSTPINIAGDNVLPNGICSTGMQRPAEETQQSNGILDFRNSLSCGTSASPASLTSEERMSSVSISSSEAPPPGDLPFKETKMNKTQLLTQKEASSPKPLLKKVKLMSSPSPERKSQTKKISSELPHNSPKLSSTHNHPADKTMSPNTGTRKHATPNASPSTERKLHKQTKLQKRQSPYSQSLDMVSPPVKHKSSRKSLSRNLSSDNTSEPTNKTQRKASLERKRRQTPQSKKSTAEPLEADQSDDKTDDLITTDQGRSKAETQIIPPPLNIANQPNIKPVLEEICYSIKSIRQITQNKRPSCLEKSNSLPDFSSHVASTFGSSSKALLAFLSVMTLKEGITNQNMDELNANNVSCAEALKMIDSLREIASIEDSQKLKASLSNLQQSASRQLLQSWRGFQELSEKCKSRNSTPIDSEQEIVTKASPGIDESVLDEIMDNLDIPERLKRELASLSVDVESDSNDEEKISDPNDEQIHEEGQLYSTENEEGMQSCRDVENQENQGEKEQEQGHNEDESNQEKANIKRVVSSNEDLAQDSCTSEVEEKDMDSKQLQMHSEDSMSIPENEHIHDDESGSEQEEQNMPSANKDLEQKVSSSEAGEQQSSEEEPEVECEEIRQEGRESDDLSNPESHSEQEEDKQPTSNYYVELNVSGKGRISSPDNQNEYLSEEEHPEAEYTEQSNKDALSNPASPSNSEEEQQSQAGCLELNVSVDESACTPDVEQPEVECQEPNVISEEEQESIKEEEHLDDLPEEQESMEEEEHLDDLPAEQESMEEEEHLDDLPAEHESMEEEEHLDDLPAEHESMEEEEHLDDLPEEQESMGEEEHLNDLPAQTKKCEDLKALIDETEEKVSSDYEDDHADKRQSQDMVEGDLKNVIENQDSYTNKTSSSLIKSDSLAKRYRFSVDEDSGNDHSSCEEHVEVEQPKVADERISSSIEELSYYDKESTSEEEHANVDTYIEESCTEYEEVSSLTIQSEVEKCERAVGKLKPPCEEVISQSIAERVSLLEKQVAEAQKRKTSAECSPTRRFSQRNAPLESDAEDSLPESALGTRSAPQSSLSFSYDSSGVITTEPESSRVKSIREMFLAKSAADIQHGHKRFPSPNKAERSDFRAETSASGGYQSQTSSELSSGEEGSPRKSITKGFVRRTIERLYGKKDASPDEEASERPPSAPKQKKKDIFSPFHMAKSKPMSELSYFNSTNTLDTLSEATRCIAFNAQVGPGDSVPIDNGRWLLKENTLIRKSVSDPVGINKSCSNSPQGEGMCEDTEEPYSLFSTKSELEDKKKSYSRKCTYFSLPHASDSDACQDDISTVSKGSLNGDSVVDIKDSSEDTKTWAERNGTLPGVGVTDFKMKDNKVHPLGELPPDGEVVLVQPGRGQGVMNRRLQEPDMLDLLYNFCGQNCPIL